VLVPGCGLFSLKKTRTSLFIKDVRVKKKSQGSLPGSSVVT
jgi:hypothetical protein